MEAYDIYLRYLRKGISGFYHDSEKNSNAEKNCLPSFSMSFLGTAMVYLLPPSAFEALTSRENSSLIIKLLFILQIKPNIILGTFYMRLPNGMCVMVSRPGWIVRIMRWRGFNRSSSTRVPTSDRVHTGPRFWVSGAHSLRLTI